MQLKRIACALGIPEPKPVQTRARTADQALGEAMAAGMPVISGGRPDDPLLDLVGW